MAGIFPESGVPAADARNSLPNVDVVGGCDQLWYSTSRCQPRFDPAAMNALMAEMLNFMDCVGLTYDCNRLDNFRRAMTLFQGGGIVQLPIADIILYQGVGGQIYPPNTEIGPFTSGATVVTNTHPCLSKRITVNAEVALSASMKGDTSAGGPGGYFQGTAFASINGGAPGLLSAVLVVNYGAERVENPCHFKRGVVQAVIPPQGSATISLSVNGLCTSGHPAYQAADDYGIQLGAVGWYTWSYE